jgi:hypothetical protein
MIATRLDEIVRDYTHEFGAVREQLGAERVRREMAETTLREGMAEEQCRRAQAQRERDDLCQELEAIIAARESPQMGEEQQDRSRPHSVMVEAQEGLHRSWWRKLIGR